MSPSLIDTFFKKFELFTDAPDAVGKMRRLVLELAVQGKLVEQNESAGNAADIFPQGVSGNAAARYQVAKHWMWIRFADVGEQRLGKMLDQKGNRGELKPYLRNTNVQWLRFQLDDIKQFRLEAEELDEYRLSPGDLLICEGGEPGRCAIWSDPDREMYFQKAIHRVRPRKGILAKYLAICLRADSQNGVLATYFTGATIKHLTGRSLGEYSIPLPPLAEQRRIVAKVDELMALCDRLEAQLKARDEKHAAVARASLTRFADAPTPANLNLIFHGSYTIDPTDLRKTILSLAIRGKLAPQDPNDELGDSIPEVTPSSPPLDVPDSWRWTEFGEISHISGGFAFKSGDYASTGVFVLRVTNIAPSGAISRDEAVFLPPEKITQELERFYLNEGDILLVMVGGSLGKIGLVTKEVLPALLNQNLWRITPVNNEVDSRFLRLITDFAVSFQRQVTHSTHGHLSREEFRRKPVALPPIREQRRIVLKVDQLMALVDQLEQQLTASRATAERLLEAVVAELTAA